MLTNVIIIYNFLKFSSTLEENSEQSFAQLKVSDPPNASEVIDRNEVKSNEKSEKKFKKS